MAWIHNNSTKKTQQAQSWNTQSLQTNSSKLNYGQTPNLNNHGKTQSNSRTTSDPTQDSLWRKTRTFNDQCGPLSGTQNHDSMEREQSGISTIPGHQWHIPECSPRKLIHNLKRRQIPASIVNFVKLLLSNRKTKLKFNDHISEVITVNNGIGQGDPLSMIL